VVLVDHSGALFTATGSYEVFDASPSAMPSLSAMTKYSKWLLMTSTCSASGPWTTAPWSLSQNVLRPMSRSVVSW